ncbi:hypothetical protein [Atrimonas thermophila]|jgi:hypothetical protein|uniref:hypothetical protein n=1 Tax=Atrimonas thermophila TaxID=3064161 RepID=UPI00399D016A
MREEVRKLLDGMSKEELTEVFEYVACLLEEKEQKEEGKQKGHVEIKMIGKWGPYAYLRWWEDGKHKAKYLGKVSNP